MLKLFFSSAPFTNSFNAFTAVTIVSSDVLCLSDAFQSFFFSTSYWFYFSVQICNFCFHVAQHSPVRGATLSKMHNETCFILQVTINNIQLNSTVRGVTLNLCDLLLSSKTRSSPPFRGKGLLLRHIALACSCLPCRKR